MAKTIQDEVTHESRRVSDEIASRATKAGWKYVSKKIDCINIKTCGRTVSRLSNDPRCSMCQGGIPHGH